MEFWIYLEFGAWSLEFQNSIFRVHFLQPDPNISDPAQKTRVFRAKLKRPFTIDLMLDFSNKEIDYESVGQR